MSMWTPANVAALRTGFAAHHSTAALAHMLGCKRATVLTKLYRLGLMHKRNTVVTLPKLNLPDLEAESETA